MGVAQVAALEQLHRDECGVALAAHVVDRDDRRMAHAPRGARLLQEARLVHVALLAAAGERHRLDRHGAPQRRIVGAIHDAHRAAPELLEDLEAAESFRERRLAHENLFFKSRQKSGASWALRLGRPETYRDDARFSPGARSSVCSNTGDPGLRIWITWWPAAISISCSAGMRPFETPSTNTLAARLYRRAH